MADTITPEELASRGGQVLIDVRTPDEYAEEHVPGAIDVPLEQLGQRIGELPEADQLVLICASGHRSAEGADLLVSRGIDAVSVEGGLKAWKDAGLAVESGPTAAEQGRVTLKRNAPVELSHPDGLLRQTDSAPLTIGTGSRLLLLAGQTPSALDGSVMTDDLAGQVEASLQHVLAVRASGGDVDDIARLTCYLVDRRLEKWEAVRDGVRRVQRSEGLADPMPPITINGVQALLWPEVLVEIEAIAVVA